MIQVDQKEKADQYSLSYDILDGANNVSDDAINSAYNYFQAESYKYYKGIFVSLNRNFKKRKDTHKNEWTDFAKVVKLCKDNNFHLKCYIKYCFINKLVPKAKGKTLSDISYLRNYPQILDYARNKVKIEKLYKIYMSIQKTIIMIKKISESDNITAKKAIIQILSSGRITDYISTGTLSIYFLSLIPKIQFLIKKYSDKTLEDVTVLMDYSNNMNRYNFNAIESLKMFYPSAMSKTIIELCS